MGSERAGVGCWWPDGSRCGFRRRRRRRLAPLHHVRPAGALRARVARAGGRISGAAGLLYLLPVSLPAPPSLGELFAQAPVDQFPGTAVESVTDSSRYFVIRIEDGNGRRAFIGLGFGDRGDAFDFNVALQDHFKWVKQQCEFAKQAQNPDEGPKLDLGFKDGQTIKINIANMRKKEGAAGTPRARPTSAGGLSLLPPPPGGKSSTVIPPSGEQLSVGGSLVQPAVVSGSGGATELWPQSKPAAAATADIWGDFTKSTGSPSSQSQPGTGWVQF